MKISLKIALFFFTFHSINLFARDTRHEFLISDVLASADAKSKLTESIKFYFSGSEVPSYERSFGVFTSNKKTNAFNKSDKEACERAMLSALIQFQKRANELGANAVINMHSNYRNVVFKSPTKYQCGAGAIMAGATLVGEVVKLGEPAKTKPQ